MAAAHPHGHSHGHDHEHGHHHHGPAGVSTQVLEELYLALSQSLARLSEEVPASGEGLAAAPHLRYGHNKQYLAAGALGDVFYNAGLVFLKTAQGDLCAAEHSHGQCEHQKAEAKGFAQRLVTRARDMGIDIAAQGFEHYREFGIGFALFFVVFEGFEHFVLDALIPPLYLVPMCPLGMAFYGATFGWWRETGLAAMTDVAGKSLASRLWTAATFSYHRWRFSKRVRWIFGATSTSAVSRAEISQQTEAIEKALTGHGQGASVVAAWHEGVRAEAALPAEGAPAVTTATSLPREAALLLATGDEASARATYSERWERAMQQVDGWLALKTVLQVWVSAGYEEGKFGLREYFQKRQAVGDFGRLINQYRRFLLSALEAPATYHTELAHELSEWTRTLSRSFQSAHEILSSSEATHAWVDGLERAALAQTQQLRRWQRCRGALLGEAPR